MGKATMDGHAPGMGPRRCFFVDSHLANFPESPWNTPQEEGSPENSRCLPRRGGESCVGPPEALPGESHLPLGGEGRGAPSRPHLSTEGTSFLSTVGGKWPEMVPGHSCPPSPPGPAPRVSAALLLLAPEESPPWSEQVPGKPGCAADIPSPSSPPQLPPPRHPWPSACHGLLGSSPAHSLRVCVPLRSLPGPALFLLPAVSPGHSPGSLTFPLHPVWELPTAGNHVALWFSCASPVPGSEQAPRKYLLSE